MNYIDIGPGPAEEKVEQANVSGTNYERMKAECRALIHQLRRMYGKEPDGAQLRVKFERDGNYGYYEVVCDYDPNKPASVEYAYGCEETPAKWDAEARRELAQVSVGVQA